MTHGGTDNPISMLEAEWGGLNNERCCSTVLYRCDGIVYFGGVKYPLRAKLNIRRLGGLLGRSIPIFPVRPSAIPKVSNGLRMAQLSGDVHQLTAEVTLDVAESGRIATWAGQALDQSHCNRIADVKEYNRNRRRAALRRHRCA